MSADFTFVHYGFNPSVVSKTALESRLAKLGFYCTADHVSGSYSFWNQNTTILMVSEVSGACGVQGLGFTLPTHEIIRHPLKFKFDSDTDTYQYTDPNGMLITALSDELEVSTYKFRKNSEAAFSNTGVGLKVITGVIYHGNPDLCDYLTTLNFRKSQKCKSSYVDYMDKFNIRLVGSGDARISTLICDTIDVFSTTAMLTVNDVELQEFPPAKNLDFGELNYKISAYNCLAAGNENSYTIENMIPEALPGMDIIFRTRKKYMHISQETLKAYYGYE